MSVFSELAIQEKLLEALDQSRLESKTVDFSLPSYESYIETGTPLVDAVPRSLSDRETADQNPQSACLDLRSYSIQRALAELQRRAAPSVTSLHLPRSLCFLPPLGAFTNLIELRAASCALTSLEDIPFLPYLELLDVTHNRLSVFRTLLLPLVPCDALRRLHVDGNPVTALGCHMFLVAQYLPQVTEVDFRQVSLQQRLEADAQPIKIDEAQECLDHNLSFLLSTAREDPPVSPKTPRSPKSTTTPEVNHSKSTPDAALPTKMYATPCTRAVGIVTDERFNDIEGLIHRSNEVWQTLQAAEAENLSLKATIAETTKRLDEMESDNKKLISDLAAVREGKDRDIEQLKHRLAEAEEEVHTESLQAVFDLHLEEERAVLENHREEKERMVAQIKKLAEENQIAQRLEATLNEKLDALRNQLERKERQHSAAAAGEVRRVAEDLEEAKKKNRELQLDVADSNRRFDQLTEQHQSLLAEAQSIENYHYRMRRKYKALRKESQESLKQRVPAVDYKESQHSIEVLRKNLAESEAARQRLEFQYQEYATKLDEARQTHSSSAREVACLQKQLQQQETTNSKQQDSIRELKQQVKSRALSHELSQRTREITSVVDARRKLEKDGKLREERTKELESLLVSSRAEVARLLDEKQRLLEEAQCRDRELTRCREAQTKADDTFKSQLQEYEKRCALLTQESTKIREELTQSQATCNDLREKQRSLELQRHISQNDLVRTSLLERPLYSRTSGNLALPSTTLQATTEPSADDENQVPQTRQAPLWKRGNIFNI